MFIRAFDQRRSPPVHGQIRCAAFVVIVVVSFLALFSFFGDGCL